VAWMREQKVTTGPKTRQFEQEFAAYVGAKHAIAVNSCTAAMHLALEAHRQSFGGCQPTDTQACRAFTSDGRLRFRAITVARPTGVNPTI